MTFSALSQEHELELHESIKSDNLTRVENLIANGVNVNFTNKVGQTPLDLVSSVIITEDSAYKGNALKIALALIKAGAKVSKTNNLHSQLLIKVIQFNRLSLHSQWSKLALALIEAGADVEAKDSLSRASALHWTFGFHGDFEITLALIEAGANVNARDDNNKTPIFWTSTNLDGTLELLKAGAEVNIMDKEGNTPLSKALQASSFAFGIDFDGIRVAEYLIAAGADVHNEAVMEALRQHNLLKGNYPRTGNLLHLFIQYGFVEAIKACINAGYDVNARYELPWPQKSEYSHTPLQRLATNANRAIGIPPRYRELPFLKDYLDFKDIKHKEEIAAILIKAGADINLSNEPSDTPLVLAIESDYTSLALILIEEGARLNWDSYDTPLNIAIERKNIPLALTLIEAGAEIKKLLIDINDTVAEGGALLHYAADGNFIKAAEILIEAGADVNIKNSDGNIPFCLAYKKDYIEVAEVIRPAGVNKMSQWFKCF